MGAIASAAAQPVTGTEGAGLSHLLDQSYPSQPVLLNTCPPPEVTLKEKRTHFYNSGDIFLLEEHASTPSFRKWRVASDHETHIQLSQETHQVSGQPRLFGQF